LDHPDCEQAPSTFPNPERSWTLHKNGRGPSSAIAAWAGIQWRLVINPGQCLGFGLRRSDEGNFPGLYQGFCHEPILRRLPAAPPAESFYMTLPHAPTSVRIADDFGKSTNLEGNGEQLLPRLRPN